MTESRWSGPVLVGVYPGQSATVVIEAAALAGELRRPLLCAYVGIDSYLTEWESGDRRIHESLHPADLDAADDRVSLELASAITTALDGAAQLEHGWSLRILAGDPSQALARAAEEVDARIVVVGTHGAGPAHAIEAWLSGAVAVHLSRTLTRPVVVVPVGHEQRGSASLA
ncbi:universal stress protein [Leifsonia sp. NPDC058248]|uniref:universal stress protein n=1 Tax=Leifsonia sp. NPDC058248 TaxID=3346402 RepID=UPI0036D9E909